MGVEIGYGINSKNRISIGNYSPPGRGQGWVCIGSFAQNAIGGPSFSVV